MDIPNVSHGTQWSDMIKTRWLFGGPSLWRFTVSEGAWKEVMHAASPSNLPLSRSGGVGLNVPLRSKGYYLGGHASNNSTNYYHSMIIFDMGLEKLTSIDLPHMIPIISPSMVFFDTGMDGVLIVFGGKTEHQGVLSFVSHNSFFPLVGTFSAKMTARQVLRRYTFSTLHQRHGYSSRQLTPLADKTYFMALMTNMTLAFHRLASMLAR